jgi:hypothetical protein
MEQGDSPDGWKEKALQEIASVKQHFIHKHGWQLKTVDGDDHITLYVRLTHRNHPERIRMLRLVYGPGFPTERPREGFIDPENPDQEGIEFWIDDGERAFKRGHNPPVICLEGTWGFHQVLHRERDPLRANLNKLLLEIQSCFDQTP